jgi:rare lipoprotein A
MLRPSYLIAGLGFFVFNCIALDGSEARSLHRLSSTRTLEETGVASFYGDELQGHKTASGRRFDNQRFTAASLTLPINSKAKVTSLKTGLSVTVTIIDRGPFAKARVIDLSKAAAEEIGITARDGVGMVLVRPLRAAEANAHDRGLDTL